MKKQKPGRIYGTISFYNLIVSIALTYIIIIIDGSSKWDINIELLIDVVKISTTLFLTTWTAIFGSGAIKKWRSK